MPLDSIFRDAWCQKTAHPSCQAAWTSDNPSLGQCSVTAILVQEFLGGTISRLEFPDGMIIYHNVVNKNVIDLTWDQHSESKRHYYENCSPTIQTRTREQLLNNRDTEFRYWVLKARVLMLMNGGSLAST